MNAEQAWLATLGQLQMEMSKASFETWVRNADLLSYEDGQFTIGVQNAFARDWLEDRLSSTLCRMLSGKVDRPVTIRFVIWQKEAGLTYSEIKRTCAGTGNRIDPFKPFNQSTLHFRNICCRSEQPAGACRLHGCG